MNRGEVFLVNKKVKARKVNECLVLI